FVADAYVLDDSSLSPPSWASAIIAEPVSSVTAIVSSLVRALTKPLIAIAAMINTETAIVETKKPRSVSFTTISRAVTIAHGRWGWPVRLPASDARDATGPPPGNYRSTPERSA